MSIFKKEPHIKSLFEVSVPAAKNKQQSLGHIAIKSTNELIDSHLVEGVFGEFILDITIGKGDVKVYNS